MYLFSKYLSSVYEIFFIGDKSLSKKGKCFILLVFIIWRGEKVNKFIDIRMFGGDGEFGLGEVSGIVYRRF